MTTMRTTARGNAVTVVAVVAALVVAFVAVARPSMASSSDSLRVRQWVRSKLASMSLKEKIGQMANLDVSYFLQQDKDGKPVAALNVDLLKKVVQEYGIGSISNSPFASGKLPIRAGGSHVSGFNVTQWIEFTNTIQKIATANGNSSVPILYYIDNLHGANYVYGATIFPHSIGMAATWNPAMIQKAATLAAKDSRTANLPWIGSPILNIGLNPLWPSIYTSFGEDPYLVSQMGVATLLGLQGNATYAPNGANPTNVASVLKHFVGSGDSISGKAKSSSWISTRMLKRYFTPAFKAAIAAGAPAVMINPGSLNGIPAHASVKIVQDLLRQDLQFTGLVTSGPGDINNLYNLHHVAPSTADAALMAVTAGIELSMGATELGFADSLYQMAQSNHRLQMLIEQAASDILAFKKTLGLFDNPYGNTNNPNIRSVGDTSDTNFAIQAARESITLLKNDGILPLNGSFKNIVLSGPTGNTVGGLSGGYTFHLQGAGEDEWGGYSSSSTLLLNINQLVPSGTTVGYSLGCNFTACTATAMADAYTLAQKADLLIITVGEEVVNVGNGDIDSLTLSSSQQYLLRNLTSLGKPMVIVLIEGRPRILPKFAVDSANAIIHAYLPGPQGGQAVAEVLLGITNPSGRLPYTYHSRTGDIRVPYYHSYSDLTNPLFPFGYGLSYTTFTYSNLQLSAFNLPMGQNLSVSVTVQNTGKRDGMEVVQVYLSDVYASVTPEVKMLRRFAKVNITAGSSVQVQFTLNAEDMSFIGLNNTQTVEPGQFIVSVANLTATFNVVQPSPSASLGTVQERQNELYSKYKRKKQALFEELKHQLSILEANP